MGKSAGAAKLIEPARQRLMIRTVEVDEFDAHADARLDDANDSQGLYCLLLAPEGDSDSGADRQRAAGANKTTAHKQVGSDALGARTGLKVENLDVSGKGIADGVAAVANRGAPRRLCGSIVHGNNVAHSRSGPVSNGCRFREGRAFPVVSVCLISDELAPNLAFGEPKR